MVKSTVELEAQRRVTAAYIAADADTVEPSRTPRVDDEAGGWVEGDPVPITPVTLRVQPAGARGTGEPTERVTEDGRVVLPTHQFIAPWDADLQAGDTFEWNGSLREIVWVSDDTEYETFGELVSGGR